MRSYFRQGVNYVAPTTASRQQPRTIGFVKDDTSGPRFPFVQTLVDFLRVLRTFAIPLAIQVKHEFLSFSLRARHFVNKNPDRVLSEALLINRWKWEVFFFFVESTKYWLVIRKVVGVRNLRNQFVAYFAFHRFTL